MRYLLDTHTFIWWNSASANLSSNAFAICQDSSNTLVLSIASVWEMQIKLQLGKLTLPAPLHQIIKTQQQANRIELLSIELAHILHLNTLPLHHKDPFDRILIAQSQVENLQLISNDPQFKNYKIEAIW